MHYIDAEAVHAHLPYEALIDGLEACHRAPPPKVERLLMRGPRPDGADDGFLLWPAWQAGEALGVKLVTVFPGNQARGTGLPSVQAVYQLFDGATGAPTATIDGTALTLRKTAADSALGARFLAREDAETMLMVGAGALGPHMIRAHRAARPLLARVLIWNRSPARAVELAARLSAEGIAAEAAPGLEKAVRAADLICCATMAETALVEGRWLGPGSHLDLVGGYTPEMREADDEAVRRASLYVDSRWFTIGHVGDLTQPMAAGVIAESDVRGDLFELARGAAPGRTSADEITLFKNAGGAHLDLFTARILQERVAAANG